MRDFMRVILRGATMLISLGLLFMVGMQSFTIYVEGSRLNEMAFYQTGLIGLLITPLFIITVLYAFRNPAVSAKAATVAGVCCLITGTATTFKSLVLWGGISLFVALISFTGSRIRKKVKLKVIPGGKLKTRLAQVSQ